MLFAALFGGLAVGIFAIVLGGVISWWAFLPPYFVFSSLTSGQAISLLSYLFASLLVVWAAEHYRRLRKRLEDEENFRKLAVEELAHRLKNKLATIQSIISFQLRDEPQTKDAILSRLMRSQPPTILLWRRKDEGLVFATSFPLNFGPMEHHEYRLRAPIVFFPQSWP